MDKYEFNIKVEQIKKMVSHGDYETAMKIADTIDWRRVRNVNILSMAATIYEKNEEYQEAKDILLLAFERAPIGKRLLFKLAELAIKGGSFQEAEDYYREFCDLAPDDPRQYILRYLILGAKGAPVEQLIHTLEQYCSIELDEKWLYELAELYAEADMGDLCVMACDKIMLMFGLGKYVEKAMDLKIQFAPLTTYQMDLVENRDKYEAKLKAVEQEFRAGTRPADYAGVPEGRDVSPDPVYMARREAAVTGEPRDEYLREGDAQPDYPQDGYPREEYPEEEYPQEEYQEAGYPKKEYPQDGYIQDGYIQDGYIQDGYIQEGYSREEYPGEDDPEEEYPETDDSRAEYPDTDYPRADHPQTGSRRDGYYREDYPDAEDYDEPRARVTIEPEETDTLGAEEELSGENIQSQWIPGGNIQSQWIPGEAAQNMSDEAVRARLHEAEVQATLAMEMSRISGSPHRPEPASAQTRVLTDIRDLTRENTRYEAHHIMIEAEEPAAGLGQAVEILKRIHRETGARNQAARITGEKLNNKGLFAFADKLTGKDLIIEQAGVIEDSILQELNQLMARDETGMNVVLIDDAANLARIHKVYPGLAKRFEYVGNSAPGEAVGRLKEGDNRPVRQVQVRAPKEALPQKASGQTGELSAKPERMDSGEPMPGKAQRSEMSVRPLPERKKADRREGGPERSEEQPIPVRRENVVRMAESVERAQPERLSQPAKLSQSVKLSQPAKLTQPEKRSKPASPKKEGRPEAVIKAPAQSPAQSQPREEEPEYADATEMDIDEFAKYACEYASDIDCSISGKSMLALYERIEIMEEDGILLTRVNAEDLIEEAADRAENPSFFKRLTGIFSSKYDRDGLLILKEEHFI